MQIQIDRAFIPANTPSMRYLHVTVSAPAAPSGATRPIVNVALVLDRSGSMDGTKIKMAREAVTHAIKLLKPTDSFGVACYDEQITTVVEQTAASKEAKALALKRVAAIDARGSTDLHGGWMRGAELLRAAPSRDADHVSKVMLLTDGLANQGVINHDALVRAAHELRSEGILTSTFGVGQDFDEALLSQLAIDGGGHFYFIERPRQIPDFFASELGETLEVVLRDVRFEIELDPTVGAAVVGDLPSESGPRRLVVKLGDLVSEQELSFVCAVTFDGAASEGARLGVRCSLHDRDGVLPSAPMEIKWGVVDAVKNGNQPVNGDVIVLVATFIAERARREALELNAAGKFEDAKAAIEDALNALRSFAQFDPRVLTLIDQLHHEALDVQSSMSPLLRKSRHYAAYQVLSSREPGGMARRRRKD